MNKTKPDMCLSPEVSNEIIDALGGTCIVSEITGRANSTVSTWRVRGIPKFVALFLRDKYKKFPVMQKEEVKKL